MPNPRNMNFVLGAIGNTLKDLGKKMKIKIPPIQCLAVNKNSGLPGNGIEGFISDKYSQLPKNKKEQVTQNALRDIFSFQKWNDVLHELSLPSVKPDFSDLIKNIRFGSGEGKEHKALKNYISQNPNILGLSCDKGEIEANLFSGDKLDVSFKNATTWIGAEVKSSISSDSDIMRGIFQCIKYKSIMEAMQITDDTYGKYVLVLLVVETKLSRKLIELKNLLNVKVIENIKVPSDKK